MGAAGTSSRIAPGRALVYAWVAALVLGLTAMATGCVTSTPPELTTSATPAAAPSFVPGDKLEVRVYGEDELGGQFQVQDDGTVNFPLVGRIALEGLTQAEAADAIEAALGDGYLKNPNVTVVVLERQNLEISVLGQVEEPGSLPFVDKLTLVQAISEAGGLTPLAAKRRVKITRRTAQGQETFEVSLDAITDGREPDILLQPGDIIFVPEAVL